MYIALEGIKGSGKSTVTQRVIERNSASFPSTDIFTFTGSMCTQHPWERIVRNRKELKTDDSFIENLFLRRALWNQALVDFSKPVILGDRSIATACVTRWKKWNDPYYTIKKISDDYSKIIRPGVIIWLKTPVFLALQNIKGRPSKSLVEQDETLLAIQQSSDAYEELLKDGIYNKKIGKVQLVELDNRFGIENMVNEILLIIKFYSRK